MTAGTVLRVDVVVNASAQEVFDAFTQWEEQSRWVLGTRVVVSSGDGAGVGSRLVAWTGIGPVGFDDPMVITRWDPPYRVDVDHRGRVVRGLGVMEAIALPGGRTRFVWSEELELPMGTIGRFGWPLVRPLVRLGTGRSLRQFARLVETGVLPRPRRA